MKKQIKVAYFSSDTPKNNVLGSNGKSLDKYCVKCETEEDVSTGNYICDLTFLIEDNINDLLQEEVILKILMDYGNEIFRISKVTVGTRYIYVVARQITISDSLTLWLEDVRPTNLNGQASVSWLLDGAEGKKEIQIVSDIDTVATAYYQRMSLYKALHDNDNSFLNRWGGEIQRRGYTVYINKRIGADRGFTIREGKNLTGFEGTSNIDNLVTRAIGQGYNGILGNYINSPLIGSYNHIYTSVIKYDDVKVKGENDEEGYDTLEQAQSELDRRINEEFSKNDIDKIKVSYTINFAQLEKTEEYKNYIIAERLFIGDDCRVYIPKLNIDIKVRAMTKKYDVLAQKTKEIKLSNYIEVKPLSIKQVIEKLESIDSTETILQQAKDNATALIKGGLKNSHVIVRENEIIIGDTKDINTMTNVWRWNAGGLGHSKTGYYGEFGTAITQDGAIVADFITTGILSANLIKAGILKSFNEKTWINMEDGTFNFADGNLSWLDNILNINGNLKQINSKTNKTACEIKDNSFIVYDHSKDDSDSHEVGRLRAYRTQNKSDSRVRNAIALNSRYDDLLIIGYLNEVGQLHEVMVFDSTGEYDGVSNVGINGAVRVYRLYFQNSTDTFAGDIIGDGNMLRFRTSLNEGGSFVFGQAGSLTDNVMEVSKDRLYHKGSIRCGESISCKNLIATGTKNRLVKTKDYGNRTLNAYETASCFFGDIGESQTDSNGEVIINIDDIFLQTVNTTEEYHVFISKYGKGDIWVEERNENMFKVKSTLPNVKFSYEIKAKQKNYESERLKEIQINEGY